MSKPSPSTEILTAILMPANRRLLFPMTDCRALFRDWKRDGNTDWRMNVFFDFWIRCVSLWSNGWLRCETESLLCDKDATSNHFKLNHASIGNSHLTFAPFAQCAARGLFVTTKGKKKQGLPFFSKLPSHLAQLHTAGWWPPCLGVGREEMSKA